MRSIDILDSHIRSNLTSFWQFLNHVFLGHLHNNKNTSDLDPKVKSFVFRSRYFLKFSFAVAYSTLFFIGAVSEAHMTKISLEISILSRLVNSKSNTQNRYSLSGSSWINWSQSASFSPNLSITYISKILQFSSWLSCKQYIWGWFF